jgi:monothiol glutaredoxin
MSLTPELRARIERLVTEHKVVLFMKGNRRFPQCGFSGRVVSLLDQLVPTYETVNILSDQELRDGLKAFTEWPTFPQLYVNGAFVGGSDIVSELFASGELATLLGAEARKVEPPSIRVSERALRAFREAMEGDDVLRLEVSPAFDHDLYFGPKQPADVVVVASGLAIHLDVASAGRAEGLSIDFVEGPEGSGFKLDNPSQPPRVRQLSVQDLAKMLAAGEAIHVFDVRTARERETASLRAATALDAEGQRALEALPHDAPIAFLCHHGSRSQSAAEHYLAQGYRNVMNVRGGIDAWSIAVDPSVPRY